MKDGAPALTVDGRGLKVAVVAASWHDQVMGGLLDGARLLGKPKKLSRDVPIHLVIGSEDPLGGPRSVELLAQAYRKRGGLTDVSVVIYPEARHEVFNETNRVDVLADTTAWLDAHLG